MQHAVRKAHQRKMKAKARVAPTPERWYEIVHGPMTGVVVSNKGRVLVDALNGLGEIDIAEATCYAWNGPPQPDSLGTVGFRNGDPNDRSFENVFWMTPSGKPVQYDLQIRHVSGDFLDNRIENLFFNKNPQNPAACWAIEHDGPEGHPQTRLTSPNET